MNDNTVIQAAPVSTCEANQQPLPPGTLIEGFEIRGVIGVGGFGIVYKAWDAMLERQVALKEYLPASLAQRMPDGQVKVRDRRHNGTYETGLKSFVNEARLLAQFDHAALVKVYRFWEMAGTAYMVMPLYQGTTLKQYMQQRMDQQGAPLPESQLLMWLVALTEALEVMHNQQCYHRDISPENIIIQEGTGLPILLDFGAARRVIGNVSQPFTVILKASYAPIEQYAEVPSMTQGPWTDVYALAAVAHFLITGKTPPSSVGRLVNDSYVPLHTQNTLPFSTQIKHAVDSALAVQPQDRTASMAQFREAMCKVQTDVLSLFDLPTHVPTTVPAMPVLEKLSEKEGDDATSIKGMLIGLIVTGLIAAVVSIAWAAGLFDRPTENTEQLPLPTPEQIETAPNPIEPAFQSVLNQANSQLTIQMSEPVLKIGEDLLRFEALSPIDGYVAVYVRSSDQSLIQLLPNVRVPVLAIQANKALTLPPANEPIQAAGPAGENQFLVVVTERPRDYAHLNMQDHYGFGLVRTEKGLEGYSPCSETSCVDTMAAAWFSVEEVE
ncbi:serine/threonine protein kinase [Limnobacter parvus]|uniref:Serine/threonine-protein kinase n=1 Tax=Limnobacter parvus TaxID=2939690 RepID=A0ABT1XKX4_9BURK|nr:serine/threonine-protein kinase [Limnobacter parvus]MCR2747168.1 serine/threonine-protein kinase [Limnobacter parvus]